MPTLVLEWAHEDLNLLAESKGLVRLAWSADVQKGSMV
jgi:hypothetical protein